MGTGNGHWVGLLPGPGVNHLNGINLNKAMKAINVLLISTEMIIHEWDKVLICDEISNMVQTKIVKKLKQ